jgi:hypothetical protein
MFEIVQPNLTRLPGHQLKPGMVIHHNGAWVTLTRKLGETGWNRMAWCAEGRSLPISTDFYTLYAVQCEPVSVVAS